MIRMTAEIEILHSEWTITSASINPDPTGTNVSAPLENVISMQKIGSNPFIFGASKLNNGEVFSSEEDYYIGKQLSNATTGAFTTPYVITANMVGSTIASGLNFRIIFDTYYNAYPKNIRVSIYSRIPSSDIPLETKTFTNSSPYFIFSSDFNTNLLIRVKITLSDWSMPGYPLRIQGIYTGLSIYGDRRNLLSISAPIKDRSDNEQPSYGIISNAGTLSLVDGTKEIKEYARLGLLTQDLDVQLWLEDTQSKKKQSLGKFKTDKWSYDNINFEVTIDFKDDLEEWQSVLIPSTDLIFNKTAKDLYNKLVELTPSKYIFEDLFSKTESIFNNISIPYFYYEKGSLWEQWNKLCYLTLSNLYKNENDKIIIKSDIGG